MSSASPENTPKVLQSVAKAALYAWPSADIMQAGNPLSRDEPAQSLKG